MSCFPTCGSQHSLSICQPRWSLKAILGIGAAPGLEGYERVLDTNDTKDTEERWPSKP